MTSMKSWLYMFMKRKLSKQLEREILAKSYASLQWYIIL